jgi:hypothetical protein
MWQAETFVAVARCIGNKGHALTASDSRILLFNGAGIIVQSAKAQIRTVIR